MIKVFHIIPHLDVGGSETVAKNISLSSNPEFEYHVIEVYRGDSEYTLQFISELQAANVIVHRSKIKDKRKGILLFFLRLSALLRRYKPDIIHTHTEIPDLAVYITKKIIPWRFKSLKWVRTIHSSLLWNNWEKIGKKVEREILKDGKNVAISHTVNDLYKSKWNVETPIIYNGVEVKSHLPFKGIKTDRINVLFAGRFEYEKGIEVVRDLVKHYSSDNTFFFHIMGAGSMEEMLKEELSNFGNCKIYGPLWELNRYLHNFDVILMPSKFEGLGLLSIETSFARRPVVISPDNGLKETVLSDWPLIAKGFDVESFINVFDKLKDIDLSKLGEHAYEFANSKFSVTQMQEDYEQLYNQLIPHKE